MLFATYNIHYGVGADGRYDVARVADVLGEADIACLQEAVRGWPQNGYADQTAEIGRTLNRYYRFHGPMEADASTVDGEGRITSRRRSFGNAIVSRWPIAWSRGVMLPKTRLAEGFDLQRGYIEAVVTAPSGPIRIYCTHFSHVGPAQRLPQVEALLTAVRDAAARGATWDGGGPAEFVFQETAPAMPEPAIVAGDFNFTPDHVEYPKIVAAGLVDACGRMGGETFPGEGRIDHVFVTPDLAPKVMRAWSDTGVPASDHWPVFVELAL
ncbi:MAG: endonuclease/exonuclease/phosphatase family protein [Proteobacteria bacterium]|nr:endonuclease/exonuclease/phosphatase family protein [Pseudomonadota bacterium]